MECSNDQTLILDIIGRRRRRTLVVVVGWFLLRGGGGGIHNMTEQWDRAWSVLTRLTYARHISSDLKATCI